MDFLALEGPRVCLRRVEADRKADVEAMYRLCTGRSGAVCIG